MRNDPLIQSVNSCSTILLKSSNEQQINDPLLHHNLAVFGVPIEATVQREQSGKAVPLVLVRCADYLVISGELAENYTESFSPFRVYHYGF